MSLGGILPLDNLGDVTHGATGFEAGPIHGGAGMDLTGTSAVGVHGPGGVNAGGDVNLAAQSAHLGVGAGGHEVVGLGTPGQAGNHLDLTVADQNLSL